MYIETCMYIYIYILSLSLSLSLFRPCSVFRSKASKMERLLKEEIPGVSVVTNPTKARKGTFEVRCGGKAIASFVSMPRPFKALREADLEKIAKDAAKACK